ESCNQARFLIGLYFHEAHAPVDTGHLRVDMRWTSGRGTRSWRRVPVAFVVPLIRLVIRSMNSQPRRTFLRRLDPVALANMVKSLTTLDLEPGEMATLLHRADALAVKDPGVYDLARREVLDRICEWASAHDDTARTIVERWVERDPTIPGLEPAS